MINFSDVIKGSNVILFPNTVIGRPPMAPSGATEIDYNKLNIDSVYIGDNTIIGANTVIYSGVNIGKNCLIGDGVHIREDVIIGDNCIIGIGTKVGARTKIGNYTRVMDITNISSDAFLGEHVFIGPGVMMGNDNAMGRDKEKGGFDFTGPYIEDWVTVGMNANLLPSIKVGKDTIVAAGSTVTKEIPNGVLVMGSPAKIKRNLKENEIRCQK
ncbi:MAG: DapH/DapD/GlmU-related protein [Campylobacterota bacterium]|nr:DapH/DapD/GlmU-related protein [Campylobacterota bacterium]